MSWLIFNQHKFNIYILKFTTSFATLYTCFYGYKQDEELSVGEPAILLANCLYKKKKNKQQHTTNTYYTHFNDDKIDYI